MNWLDFLLRSIVAPVLAAIGTYLAITGLKRRKRRKAPLLELNGDARNEIIELVAYYDQRAEEHAKQAKRERESTRKELGKLGAAIARLQAHAGLPGPRGAGRDE